MKKSLIALAVGAAMSAPYEIRTHGRDFGWEPGPILTQGNHEPWKGKGKRRAPRQK